MGPNWTHAEGFILGVGAKMFTIAGLLLCTELLLRWYTAAFIGLLLSCKATTE